MRRLIEIEVDEEDAAKLSEAAMATLLRGDGGFLTEVPVVAVFERLPETAERFESLKRC